MEGSKMERKGSFAQVGWTDRWATGWTVENLPFVLPPPPNDVAVDGSTCLLLARTQVLGGQIEPRPDLIPRGVRPVFLQH